MSEFSGKLHSDKLISPIISGLGEFGNASFGNMCFVFETYTVYFAISRSIEHKTETVFNFKIIGSATLLVARIPKTNDIHSPVHNAKHKFHLKQAIGLLWLKLGIRLMFCSIFVDSDIK